MKKKSILANWPKYLLQWGILAALVLFLTGIIPGKEAADPESLCPMGGLQALATYGSRGSLPCSMSSLQILMGIALAAAVILFSKLFCGYLCPIGSVEDILTKLRKAIGLRNLSIRNGSIADKVLRIFKYGLLFYIFYSTTAASELACKMFDPYYAVATGFKGEIVLWLSICLVCLVVLGGIIVDRFWCRYVCPLGALSNTLKFWIWTLAVAAAWVGLNALGCEIPWWAQFAVVCVVGYILEIAKQPKLQLVKVIKDDALCSGCGLCTKACPYAVNVADAKNKVNSVDCTLCGECVAACGKNALAVAPACVKDVHNARPVGVILPAALAVVFTILGIWIGGKIELPTIDVKWGIEQVDSLGHVTPLIDKSNLKTFKAEGLRSVKCYGSSMAFKGRLERIAGVHGVKTFVGKHSAVITYDSSVTTEDKILEQIFVPTMFRVLTPDHKQVDSVKIYTIRTEKMSDKMDINYFGLQLRLADSLIYAVQSEFACPLIVKVYAHPSTNYDAVFFKEQVEKKVLAMPVHGGGVKETPVDFKWVKMENEISYMDTPTLLHKLFTPFKAEFKSRVQEAEGKKQYIYEIADHNYEKPIITRNMPFVSNHLSKNDGVIGVYLNLNEDLVPAIQVRYAAPMTADRIWELLTMPEWTITYGKDDVRTVPAKLGFKTPGVVKEYK